MRADRRRHPRIPGDARLPVRVEAGIRGGRFSHRVECVDLSIGGIRCVGDLPLVRSGHRVVVALRTPSLIVGRRLTVPALVQRVDVPRGEWALRFDLEDSATQERLRRYVTRAFRTHQERLALPGSESNLAEAFRILQASLGAAPEAGTRIVAVTSCVPGEGKSFVARGLALALARSGARTLLVDADLYEPSLHETFGVPSGMGVTQALESTAVDPLAGMVRPTAEGVDLITAGSSGLPPSEPYRPDRVRRLIERLRTLEYRVIVIDTPPLLGAAMAAQVSQSADDVLLAIRSDLTREQDLRQVCEHLRQIDVSLRGVVLNDHPDGGPRHSGSNVHLPPVAPESGAGPDQTDGESASKDGSGLAFGA